MNKIWYKADSSESILNAESILKCPPIFSISLIFLLALCHYCDNLDIVAVVRKKVFIKNESIHYFQLLQQDNRACDLEIRIDQCGFCMTKRLTFNISTYFLETEDKISSLLFPNFYCLIAIFSWIWVTLLLFPGFWYFTQACEFSEVSPKSLC